MPWFLIPDLHFVYFPIHPGPAAAEIYSNICMFTRVFLKGHFVKKKKCSPHHVTGGYLERSYPEGETDQTSLGGRH